VFEEILEEVSSDCEPKAASKADRFISIRFIAASIASCSVSLLLEWKGMVERVLSARNSARRSQARA
jgi:hypothetical protein